MRRSKLLGFGVVALLAISLIPALTAYAKLSEEDKAEKFIEVAQKAYREATRLANRTEAAGGDVTLAETLIAEGLTLLDEARGNHSAKNYALAFEMARAAQERFRDAIEALNLDEDEEEEGAGQGILVAIEQHMRRIERLNDTIKGLDVDPGDKYLDWAKGNLTEAYNNLQDAKEILEGAPANASKAARLLGEANRNIEEAYKALKLIGDHNVTARAESFLKGLKKQFQKVEDDIGEDVEAQEKLEEIQLLLEGAEDDLLGGDKKDALEKTKDARDLLHDFEKELKKSEHGKP